MAMDQIQKAAFLNYLDQAFGSADEARPHLECLFQSGSLKNWAEYSAPAAAGEKVEKNHSFATAENRDKPSRESVRPRRLDSHLELFLVPGWCSSWSVFNRESRIENRS
jgi:hypothetical protein